MEWDSIIIARGQLALACKLKQCCCAQDLKGSVWWNWHNALIWCFHDVCFGPVVQKRFQEQACTVIINCWGSKVWECQRRNTRGSRMVSIKLDRVDQQIIIDVSSGVAEYCRQSMFEQQGNQVVWNTCRELAYSVLTTEGISRLNNMMFPEGR